MTSGTAPAESVHDSTYPVRFLRENGTELHTGLSEDTSNQAEEKTEEKRYLLCRACSTIITSQDLKVSQNDHHEHTFFNPQGIVFEIGCFSKAPGCIVIGKPTDQFSWFAGFYWRYASCLGCTCHLGWFYEGDEGGNFFGLILNKLVEEKTK